MRNPVDGCESPESFREREPSSSVGSALEQAVPSLLSSNPLPTPDDSGSSSSSTRCSLSSVLPVMTLAIEPARLRDAYLGLRGHDPDELTEDMDDLRASNRSSIA